MKRMLSVMGALALAMSGTAAKAQNGGKFVPPEVVSASEISYPANANSPGFVTLQVNLDGNANIQNIQVVRDVPPLTSAARTAEQGWSFTAGTSGVPSSIQVTAVFNPFNPAGVG